MFFAVRSCHIRRSATPRMMARRTSTGLYQGQRWALRAVALLVVLGKTFLLAFALAGSKEAFGTHALHQNLTALQFFVSDLRAKKTWFQQPYDFQTGFRKPGAQPLLAGDRSRNATGSSARCYALIVVRSACFLHWGQESVESCFICHVHTGVHAFLFYSYVFLSGSLLGVPGSVLLVGFLCDLAALASWRRPLLLSELLFKTLNDHNLETIILFTIYPSYGNLKILDSNPALGASL